MCASVAHCCPSSCSSHVSVLLLGVSQQYTDSKQSWPWERGARAVSHPSAVCSRSLRQLNRVVCFSLHGMPSTWKSFNFLVKQNWSVVQQHKLQCTYFIPSPHSGHSSPLLSSADRDGNTLRKYALSWFSVVWFLGEVSTKHGKRCWRGRGREREKEGRKKGRVG